MTVADSIKAQLDEAEHVIRAQMVRISELEAEVARLTEGADAISTLRSIYRDRDLPESLRAKAASACLQHEVPRLQSVPPAVDLAATEVIEPLAVVVERQRKRMNQLQGQDIEVLPNGQVLLPKPGSNSSGDDHS